jgi:hypothetical protein
MLGENKMVDWIKEHNCFDVVCCACGEKDRIFTTWKRHHGYVKDISKSVRLKETLDFCKKHYINNAYRLRQKNERLGEEDNYYWKRHYKEMDEIPDCNKLRTEGERIVKPFKIVDDDDNEFQFHLDDKQFKKDLTELRQYLKPMKI